MFPSRSAYFPLNMCDIIIYIARWWEKYLSKRSLIKHTCSWRDKLLHYEHWTDKQKYFYVYWAKLFAVAGIKYFNGKVGSLNSLYRWWTPIVGFYELRLNLGSSSDYEFRDHRYFVWQMSNYRFVRHLAKLYCKHIVWIIFFIFTWKSLCLSATYVCVSGGEKCLFSENSTCFVFLLPPLWESTSWHFCTWPFLNFRSLVWLCLVKTLWLSYYSHRNIFI